MNKYRLARVTASAYGYNREDKHGFRAAGYEDACKLLGTSPIAADAQWTQGLSGTGTSGVQFTEVEVDVETGIVKVKRVLAMQDCGLIVDKLTAESQVYGGIVGSISFALYEDRILDRGNHHVGLDPLLLGQRLDHLL